VEEAGIMKLLSFRETKHFSDRVIELLNDDAYAKLQLFLAEFPDAGDLVKGGGGIRKVRVALPGRGKSGGARVIYFWVVADDAILLLDIYAKNNQTDLSDEQIKALHQEVKGLAKP
jgi:mRNA-degrading endonuclease RelE of RelBE toxin-antitoxin system